MELHYSNPCGIVQFSG